MASPEGLSDGTEAADVSGSDPERTGPRFTLGDGEDAEGMFLMPIIEELNAMDGQPSSSGSPYD